MTIRKKITIANQNARGLQLVSDNMPDHVQPFMLEASQLRGRIVRLPQVLSRILGAHDYPKAISLLLAEALCLTTLLARMLKFDGIFTLQIRGEGPVRSLVCDMTHDGVLRGYVGYDEERLAEIDEDDRDFLTLLEKGYVAFTVDQANSDDRYQGITALHGVSLTESVQHYFHQSEQIKTGFVTHVTQLADGTWNGGAVMLQQLALAGGIYADQAEPSENTAETVHSDRVHAGHDEDSWRRSMMLLQTLTKDELLDENLPLTDMLYRIFHEEGVRVFDTISIVNGCRCSEDKLRLVIDNIPEDEKQEIAEDGVITATCEFCNTHYRFPVAKIIVQDQ